METGRLVTMDLTDALRRTGAGDPHAHDWDWSKSQPRQGSRPLTPLTVPLLLKPRRLPGVTLLRGGSVVANPFG